VLRQLARLGRSVPFAGSSAVALAVYADGLDEPVRAQEAGYEGIACVDDAARALDLYCDLWAATGLPWTMRWCQGLLEFVLAMQDTDGRWVNFILDWEGTPNLRGRTSIAGGGFWQARATLALARASRVLSDPRIVPALLRGLPHIAAASNVPSDVRALHILTALTLSDTGNDQALSDLVPGWSDELVRCRIGDVLMNAPGERGSPHLWGHIQEGVLADAGARLGRDDLLVISRRSADALFTSVVGACYDAPHVQPYDVSSVIFALDRLADVTARSEYAALAAASRAWFNGRNPAGEAVYDRRTGRVGDGVDDGRVSTHSGAEANIVGAQALFQDAIAVARRLASAEALPASVTVTSSAPA